ncbi:hypothetical protein Tco_0044947 [Tanacetum coccineum]
MEKYKERQRDLHIAFLDLEKAYDSVHRELIWRTLIDKGTPRRYLRVIMDMYEWAKTRVRTIVGNSDFFPVKVGFHQRSAINDIVFVAESEKGLNNRLENWKVAREDNGL